MDDRHIRFAVRRTGGRTSRRTGIGSRAGGRRVRAVPGLLPCRYATWRTRVVGRGRRPEPRYRLGPAIGTRWALARRARRQAAGTARRQVRVRWSLGSGSLRWDSLRWNSLRWNSLRWNSLRIPVRWDSLRIPVRWDSLRWGSLVSSALPRRMRRGRVSCRRLSLLPKRLLPKRLLLGILRRCSRHGSAVSGSAGWWALLRWALLRWALRRCRLRSGAGHAGASRRRARMPGRPRVPSGRRALPLRIRCPSIVRGPSRPGRRLLLRLIRPTFALPGFARVRHRLRSSAHSLTLLRRPFTGALGVTLPQVVIPIRLQPRRGADSLPHGVRYRRADHRLRRWCESARADRSPAGSSAQNPPVTTGFRPPMRP